MPIDTLEGLREHLQWAIELEHMTIPAYLCAMYTIVPGTNAPAYDVIRSVVAEEMLHLTLAANVLNAVGGRPALDDPRFVPEYPAPLPHSDGSVVVGLGRLSPNAVDTFMRIERPAKPHAPPEADRYHTIGQFYEAIEDGLKTLTARFSEREVFSGDARRQVTPALYYSGGGEALPVTDLRTALLALRVIVDQGEGIDHTIFDGDHVVFGQDQELAHYFRFQEIALGRYYRRGDTVRSGPTGPVLPVRWDQVYPMRPNPKPEDYPEGSELRRRSDRFDRTYSSLLDQLHSAFNGDPELLVPAVWQMFDLKYQAQALIQNEIPGREGVHAGPSFELARVRVGR